MPPTAQPADTWAAGDRYEPYVGRWSRRVAREFLAWLDIPPGKRWLDVGCGTGALSQTIIGQAQPAEVVGVDRSEGFLAFARAPQAAFHIGDAQALEFDADRFDAAVSGLVLNFVPDPAKAAGEVRRVVSAAGTVAACVWDYAGEMRQAMMARVRKPVLLWAALAGLVFDAAPARACACCTNTGQRHEAVEALGADKLDEIGRLRFASKAELFTSEADPDMIKGIAATWAQFDLRVTREKDRWIFAFRDKDGRSGTLVLTLPKSMAVFAVDPRRGERKGGTGPALYREWKLASRAAGTGIFAPGMGKSQRITLVLQGNGNSCAEARDFTHWMLAVSGPLARYHLFGDLLQR